MANGDNTAQLIRTFTTKQGSAQERMQAYLAQQSSDSLFLVRSAQRTASSVDQINSKMGQLADGVNRTAEGMENLAGGVHRVADGMDNIANGMHHLTGGMNQLAIIADQNSQSLHGIQGSITEMSSSMNSAAEVQQEVLRRAQFQEEVEESIFQLEEATDNIYKAVENGEDIVTAYFAAQVIQEDIEFSGLVTNLIKGIDNKKRYSDNKKRLSSIINKLSENPDVKAANKWVEEQERIQAENLKERAKEEQAEAVKQECHRQAADLQNQIQKMNSQIAKLREVAAIRQKAGSGAFAALIITGIVLLLLIPIIVLSFIIFTVSNSFWLTVILPFLIAWPCATWLAWRPIRKRLVDNRLKKQLGHESGSFGS